MQCNKVRDVSPADPEVSRPRRECLNFSVRILLHPKPPAAAVADQSVVMANGETSSKKGAAGSWGRAGRREPGLGTGRGGDVTGVAYLLSPSAMSP
jgi:hypothetical protein